VRVCCDHVSASCQVTHFGAWEGAAKDTSPAAPRLDVDPGLARDAGREGAADHGSEKVTRGLGRALGVWPGWWWTRPGNAQRSPDVGDGCVRAAVDEGGRKGGLSFRVASHDKHRGALRGTPGSVCPQPEPNATELPSCAPISARTAQRQGGGGGGVARRARAARAPKPKSCATSCGTSSTPWWWRRRW